LFPFLTDLEMSEAMYLNDIVNFFQADNISVINVSQLARNIPVAERIVNMNDTHASRKINHIIAQEILKNSNNMFLIRKITDILQIFLQIFY